MPCDDVQSLQSFEGMKANIWLKMCMFHGPHLKLDANDIQL